MKTAAFNLAVDLAGIAGLTADDVTIIAIIEVVASTSTGARRRRLTGVEYEVDYEINVPDEATATE